MNEKDKQEYLEQYEAEKKKGVPFYPDIIFKDAVVSFIILLILVALAYFVGAALEERANPSDTAYNPRPEWYFLFLFQLLKYFPGNLEVIGVVVLPAIVIIMIFVLPFVDKSKHRHYKKRMWFVLPTFIALAGAVALSILSIIDANHLAEVESGDPIGNLYIENCAGCHGTSIRVSEGVNLHEIISQGNHAGMPPWGADLSIEQIDGLVGFILSPSGSELFINNCGECHLTIDLVDVEPFTLKSVLDRGASSEVHTGLDLPFYTQPLTAAENTHILNYLISPDGQQLFSQNCSACHGSTIAYADSEEDLKKIIETGGMHVQMPSWADQLDSDTISILAEYVVDPSSNSGADEFFQQNCYACHFSVIPQASTYEQAYDIIALGGSHQTMPVWGDILTTEQIDSLVTYISLDPAGLAINQGRELYGQYCAACHGDFGEGGINPANTNDIIAPISTSEYLKTRDDYTLTEIIAQGQPNFGMAPFSFAYGGLLDNEEIESLVAYIRSWEDDPPVEIPPLLESPIVNLQGKEIFQSICSQCHGLNGEGGSGPALNSAEFLTQSNHQDVFDIINDGHLETPMVAWNMILTPEQITDIVNHIFNFSDSGTGEKTEITFEGSILPIFQQYCEACHSESVPLGGWISTNYDDAVNSGDNGPAVIIRDADNSLLIKKLYGTDSNVTVMPPSGSLDESLIQIILDWINSGTLE